MRIEKQMSRVLLRTSEIVGAAAPPSNETSSHSLVSDAALLSLFGH